MEFRRVAATKGQAIVSHSPLARPTNPVIVVIRLAIDALDSLVSPFPLISQTYSTPHAIDAMTLHAIDPLVSPFPLVPQTYSTPHAIDHLGLFGLSGLFRLSRP
jgi:hypothetical protein